MNNIQSIVLTTNWTLTLFVCCVRGKNDKNTHVYYTGDTDSHRNASSNASFKFKTDKRAERRVLSHPKWRLEIDNNNLLFQKLVFIQKFQDFVNDGGYSLRSRRFVYFGKITFSLLAVTIYRHLLMCSQGKLFRLTILVAWTFGIIKSVHNWHISSRYKVIYLFSMTNELIRTGDI